MRWASSSASIGVAAATIAAPLAAWTANMVGAGVDQAVGQAMQGMATSVAMKATGALTYQGVELLMHRGGKLDTTRIVADAFGNVIGNSLLGAMDETDSSRAQRDLQEAYLAQATARPTELTPNQLRGYASNYLDTLGADVDTRNGAPRTLARYGVIADDPEDSAFSPKLVDPNAYAASIAEAGDGGTPFLVVINGATHPKTAVGETLDQALIGGGKFLRDVESVLKNNPVIGYALKGLEFVLAPVPTLLRAAGDEVFDSYIEQASQAVVGAVSHVYADAGYIDNDPDNAGLGVLFAASTVIGGGVTKALGAVKTALRRTERMVENVAETAVPRLAEPTGQFYSVGYEMKLGSTSYSGVSGGAHFQEANESLLKAMEGAAAFAGDIQSLGVNLQRTPTGLAPRTSPSGWTWHHAEDSSEMQLVPRSQHQPGSIFQDALHPNGKGGYSIWGK